MVIDMIDIAIGLSLIAITAMTWVLVFISKRILVAKKVINPLIDLVYYFIYVKLSLHYFIPAILRLISDFQFEKEYNISPISVLYIYMIELISWFFWLILFSWIMVRFRQIIDCKKNNYFIKNINVSRVALIFIGAGFSCLTLFPYLNLTFPQELDLFKSLFLYSGVSIGPILVACSNKYLSREYFYFGLLLCLVNVFTIPTRGAFIYMLLFFYFLVEELQINKKFRSILKLAAMMSIVFYLIFGFILIGSLSVDVRGNVALNFSNTLEKSGSRSSLDELEWRLGSSTRMGTAFIDLYDRGEGAGILPIKHSLMGLIPRVLSPDKPIPSTVDPNDIYSQGMYVIMREYNGYSTYSMTEFPTGAHFYWEFGVLGVIVLSLISALYISICIILFSDSGILGLSFMLSTFKPWGYLDPKIWVSDLILQLYQVILPGLLLVFIIRIGFRLLKIIGNPFAIRIKN